MCLSFLQDVIDGFKAVAGAFGDMAPKELAKMMNGSDSAWKRIVDAPGISGA
jgi:hypothetical protein